MNVIGDWLVWLPYVYLSEAIQDTAASYEEAFDRHYGLGDSEVSTDIGIQPEAIVSLRRLSKKLFTGATSLARPSRVPQEQLDALHEATEELREWEEALLEYEREHGVDLHADGTFHAIQKPEELDSPEGRLHFLLMCFELDAFDSIMPDLHQVSQRMLQLLQVMMRNPGEQTRAYLSRAARCYLFDLEAEFALMARATLEQRIQEVVDDDHVEDLVGPAKSGRVTLARRIEACVAAGVFDRSAQQAAENVLNSGNAAAHLSPSLTKSPGDLLLDLEAALRALGEEMRN